MPEKCGHGVTFDDFCRECEILWAEEFIQFHECRLKTHRERLAKLKSAQPPQEDSGDE